MPIRTGALLNLEELLVKKSSSSKRKQKRSSLTRIDSGFARPPLRAKAFFLALGILAGALVAAGVKSFLVPSEKSEIELSESIDRARSETKQVRSQKSRSNPVATAPKVIPKPRLPLTPEPSLERVAETETPRVVESIKERTKEKIVSIAPRRKAIAVIASAPVPTRSVPLAIVRPKVNPAPSLSQTPSPTPLSPVPRKMVAVKTREERPMLEEISSLSLSEEPRDEAPAVIREKPKKAEHQENLVKESSKLATHIPKDENFRSRLKKVKKVDVNVVEAEAEDIDTATSPFQDRLRKSVK